MEQPTTETQRPPTLLVLVTTIAPGTDRLRLASLPPADATPVRVGVGVVGAVVVFGLIMVARSLNRRPQH